MQQLIFVYCDLRVGKAEFADQCPKRQARRSRLGKQTGCKVIQVLVESAINWRPYKPI